MSYAKPSLARDQAGMASILVTMIIMMLLSLIVLAAARLTSRQQRQSIDRQLSTQAFYAAESGVNDTLQALTNDRTLFSNDYTSNCTQFQTAASLPSSILNPSAGSTVKYTCLLVDPTPTTWEASISDTARTVPVKSKNSDPISYVELSWQDKSGSSDFSGCPTLVDNLPTADSWDDSGCNTPVMRVDIVPTNAPTRNNLNNGLMTAFLFPRQGAAGVTTVPYAAQGATNQPAQKILVQCSSSNTPKFCNIKISNLGATSYYLRLKPIYGSASVTVAATDISGNKFELANAQVVIDATGKANDVLRRIQVRAPLVGDQPLPEFAIQSSDTLCKVLNVSGANATSANPVDCPLN